MPEGKNQLNIKLDEKTHWLANLSARDLGLTLAEFVERLILSGITDAAMREAIDDDEATPGHDFVPKPTPPLWRESLWDPDTTTRLFYLAVHANDLLTRSQQALWSSYCAEIAKQRKNASLKTFKQFYASERGE